MSLVADIRVVFRGGDRAAADKIVPTTGATARLTMFAAGAVAFMMALALLVSLAAGGLAARWANALEGVAMIEVTSGDTADVARVLSVLETTPGAEQPAEIDAARQQALLAPWLGEEFPVESLALPRLIEFREGRSLDTDGLALRLEGEVPSARYARPDAWQAAVAADARRIRSAGWGLVLLTAGVMAALVTLAARTALAAQVGVIETLRLIGAEDRFIATAFVRRFTLRAGLGAAVGVGAALVLVAAVSQGEAGVLVLLRPSAVGILLCLLVPGVAGALAFGATRRAAGQALERLL